MLFRVLALLAGGGVGAVLFDEFVVDAEQQEGCCPLPDEERLFALACDFES